MGLPAFQLAEDKVPKYISELHDAGFRDFIDETGATEALQFRLTHSSGDRLLLTLLPSKVDPDMVVCTIELVNWRWRHWLTGSTAVNEMLAIARDLRET